MRLRFPVAKGETDQGRAKCNTKDSKVFFGCWGTINVVKNNENLDDIIKLWPARKKKWWHIS